MPYRPDQLPPDWAYFYAQQSKECSAPLRDFYAGGLPEQDTLLAESPMLAIDFETTGLNAQTHEIVSVGLIPFDLERIYCQQARHILVKPKGKLESLSVTFHGITHSDLMHAPSLKEILPEILGIMLGRLVVVHFREIERNFLWQKVWEDCGQTLLFPVIDTMELERACLQEQRRWWQRGPAKSSLRLGDCRARYHLPHYSLHHALTDALATAELLQAQVQHNWPDATRIDQLWR